MLYKALKIQKAIIGEKAFTEAQEIAGSIFKGKLNIDYATYQLCNYYIAHKCFPPSITVYYHE